MDDNVNNQILTWLITISGQLDQISRTLSDMQGDNSIISGPFRNAIICLEGDTFGERLKNALKLRNMTGKELGDRIGVNFSTISRYVNNKNYPKPWIIKNIADVLMIDVADLVNPEDQSIADKEVQDE